MPNELREALNEVPELPNEVPELPNELREAPNEVPELPNELREALNEVPELPNELPEALNEVPELPNELREAPKEVRAALDELPELPNQVRAVLDEVRDLLKEVRAVLNELRATPGEVRRPSRDLLRGTRALRRRRSALTIASQWLSALIAQVNRLVYYLCMDGVSREVELILQDLNPWWTPPHPVRPAPPPYRRRHVDTLAQALRAPRSIIQVLRGPRQVGKTTAIYQVISDLLKTGSEPRNLYLIRFDLEPLREVGLLPLVRWYAQAVRQADLSHGRPATLFLDEVHKLDRWDEEIKHLFDTFPVQLVITGSSSVLVARGQRESLAGRAITIDFPPFLFREMLEAWHPEPTAHLPPPATFSDIVRKPRAEVVELFQEIHRQPAQRKHSWRRQLERYYNRGGYPRLYSGEVEEDRWADYLVETVFERVLGVDVPELFPVKEPRLLRHLYLEIARRTGTEVSQGGLAQDSSSAGFKTSQAVVGRYLHYLADALLIREFRRYPLTRSRTARVPLKVTLTDLGVRNAIFRGAPSLWESPPDIVGPLVETLVPSVLRGPNLQVHFYRDYSDPQNRRSTVEEVDYVIEALDGTVIPVEVKFRGTIQSEDTRALRSFIKRFKSPYGILVTREEYGSRSDDTVLSIPVLEFLLAF